MFALTIIFAIAATVSAFPKTTVPAYLSNPKIDTNANWRVVGGSDAPTGAYPFMVSLRGSWNNHFCGGSLLNSRTVLTAAHCLIGASPSNINAVAGTNTLNAGGVSIGAQTLIIHADYDDNTIANDIGIVALQSAFEISSLIGTITPNAANTGVTAAILIGWGVTGVNDNLPNNLQRLDSQTITHSQCQAVWGSSVAETQICALTRAGEGACFGDSGGPLIETSTSNQLGIVSFGVACAVGFPDVYARVSAFSSWINNNS